MSSPTSSRGVLSSELPPSLNRRRKGRADGRSCAQLSYGDVQNVIDGSKLDAKVDGDHSTSEVEEDIKNLHNLASKLRARRVAAGAVLSKKLKVKFSLDDNKRPIDCEPYETKEANHLVEEVSSYFRIKESADY
jgi:protein SSD1